MTFTAQDPQGASAIDTDTEILAVSFYVHNASPGEVVDARRGTSRAPISTGAFDAPDAVYHQVVASNQSSDATLSSITVQGGRGRPHFRRRSLPMVTLPSGTERVDVQAVPTDENAQVTGTATSAFPGPEPHGDADLYRRGRHTKDVYPGAHAPARRDAGAAVTASPGATIAPSAAPEGKGCRAARFC